MGLELFHFHHPATTIREDSFEFWMTGLNHVALTSPDVAGTARRIADHGGRIRSGPVVLDAAKGFAVLYAEDPWGTVIELCSHPYAQMWA